MIWYWRYLQLKRITKLLQIDARRIWMGEKPLAEEANFCCNENAVFRPKICPVIRMIVALRTLAYSKSYDGIKKLWSMSKKPAWQKFCCFYGGGRCSVRWWVFSQAESGWSFQDSQHHCHAWLSWLRWELGLYIKRWKNCLMAWTGLIKGKGKKPIIALKAVANGELWIWARQFGKLGSLNDIRILNAFVIINNILDGKMIRGFTYLVNGNEYRNIFFFVKGIYLTHSISVRTTTECGD